jgi:hypothetical protein
LDPGPKLTVLAKPYNKCNYRSVHIKNTNVGLIEIKLWAPDGCLTAKQTGRLGVDLNKNFTGNKSRYQATVSEDSEDVTCAAIRAMLCNSVRL